MEIKTTQEIITSLSNKMRDELNLTFIGRTFLYPFIVALSAFIKLIYLYAAAIEKNIWPDSADPESIGGTLERFGRVALNRGPNPATEGTYLIDVTATAQTSLRAGLTLKDPQSDTLVVIQNAQIAEIGVTPIEVESLDSGTENRLDIGSSLEFTQPIANVNQIASVTSVLVEPTDAETTEEYRELVLSRYQQEPSGGSGADYRRWSEDVDAVRRVYVYVALNNPGTLNCYVEQDSTAADPFTPIIPGQGILDSLYFEEVGTTNRFGAFVFDPDATKPILDRGRLPVGVFKVDMFAIALITVDVTITNLESDSPADAQDRINEALNSYAYSIRPFVSGADDPNRRTDTLRQSELAAEAINVLQTTESIESLTVSIAGTGISSRLFTAGDVPLLNIQYL